MKLAIFAFTRQGCRTARRIMQTAGRGHQCRIYTTAKYAEDGFWPVLPPLADFIGPVFARADALIFVGACGIAVRAIAPHIKDKQTDPAVLAVDEAGRFVISLLSGHIGGANALAEGIAGAISAIPVVTTATDVNGLFSVDEWAARRGFVIDSMAAAKAVSAAVLQNPVAIRSDFPVMTDLPAGLVAGEGGDIGILLSWRAECPFARTLRLIPPVLHLGIGCRRGIAAEALEDAVTAVLRLHSIDRRAVKCVASVDLKAGEQGLLQFCRQNSWPVAFYSVGELGALPGNFTASPFVQSVAGVDNVCERAAMIGAERLIVRKTAVNGVTVAVAAEHLEVRFD